VRVPWCSQLVSYAANVGRRNLLGKTRVAFGNASMGLLEPFFFFDWVWSSR
jgi:hypothetical protein